MFLTQTLLFSLSSINLYLNVYTMEVFEERISRLRNTPLLFDSFQHRQNFLPVVDTSSNIFLLVIEGVKVNSLVNKKGIDAYVISRNSNQNALPTYSVFFKSSKVLLLHQAEYLCKVTRM